MERVKSKMPNLSLVVPSSSKNPSQLSSQKSSLGHVIVPAKQKRLIPVACRLVAMDQWFTTRIDRTWNVLDLKIWLLSKALPTPVLPLPASYRPSSPVTFAATPPPPPRPKTATLYHTLTPPVEFATSTTQSPAPSNASPISPITFAAPPYSPSRLSTSTSHDLPQHSGRQVVNPADPSVSAVPTVPSPSSNARRSLDQDEDVPLYANSYGAMINNHSEDEDAGDTDYNRLVRIMPRSIPYSYNTGTPAISGLAALKSNSNNIVSGSGCSGSLSTVDIDLIQQATAIANRWHIYSFSTGMLLSDDLPLAEYSIRPYELLELHRAGAYVSLPRTILPGLDSLHNHDTSKSHSISTKTTSAYPSTTRNLYPHTTPPTRESFPQGDTRDHINANSSDDEYDDLTAGSPYAQPYFDGWVWVLREGASGPNDNRDPGTNSVGDGHGLPGRKMHRRGRAKSETAKPGRGSKDRARMERERKDLKQPLLNEGDTEVQLQENGDLWKKRWLIIREGIMTLWKERKDDLPEERYKIAACAGLYGADRLRSVLATTSHSNTPFATSLVVNANAPYASASTYQTSLTSSALSHHIICARFRQRTALRGTQAGRMDGKASGKSHQRIGTWVVLKLADATIHEHLLRIFHRLSYSSPVASSSRSLTSSPSVATSLTLHTRTLRTDFLPNPIPHPLSHSCSVPSPIQQGDKIPMLPVDDLAPSDGSEYDEEWVEDGSSWGRSQRKVFGKCVARYIGLGRGVGVRYPEWRENIIQKAIQAGRGLTLPESQGGLDLSPGTQMPRTDQLHMYGFREYLDNYPRDEYDSDDSDSDAFSETEWDGWAYDLDRPKVLDEIGTGPGHTPKPSRDGLTTQHGSPTSDPELFAVPGPALDSTSFPSKSTLRPRSRSCSNDSPVQADVSDSSLSPTTPGARVRASTISAHANSSSNTIMESIGVVSHFPPSGSSQIDRRLRPDVTATLRTIEPNTARGARSLMRGLSMRMGKESFLRGLENALDFVEGR